MEMEQQKSAEHPVLVEHLTPATTSPQRNLASFVHRVLIVIGITAGTVLLLVFFWHVVNVLLLIFASILMGVILRGAADFIHDKTRLPYGLALALVIMLLFSSLIALIVLQVPNIAREVSTLVNLIQQALNKLQDQLVQWEIPTNLLPSLESGLSTGSITQVLSRVLGIFSNTFGAISSFLFILVLSIYLAIEPGIYVRGIMRLFPRSRRNRVRQVLTQLKHTIRGWILGQMVSMLVIGTLATIGLMLFKVPLALTLGILTAITNFVPILGAIVAAIPTLLMALTVSPATALYVGIFYIILQNLEGNLITPVVQRKVIDMPLAMILVVQSLLVTTVGLLGMILAAPLIACTLVLVKMLYVEDVLNDRFDQPA